MPTAEDRKLVKEANRLKKYIARFGWRLAGFGHGVLAITEDNKSLNFDAVEWREVQNAISQVEADGFKRGRQAGLEELVTHLAAVVEPIHGFIHKDDAIATTRALMEKPDA